MCTKYDNTILTHEHVSSVKGHTNIAMEIQLCLLNLIYLSHQHTAYKIENVKISDKIRLYV